MDYNRLKERYVNHYGQKMNDLILIVDNEFKEEDDDDRLYVLREFIRIDDEYAYNFIHNGLTDYTELSISLKSKNFSNNFLKYILNMCTDSDYKYQKHINNILVCDYRMKINEIKLLKLDNIIVNRNVVNTIKKFFKNLDRIIFQDCIITNMDFSYPNCNYTFYYSRLDSTNLFNNFSNNLELYKCSFVNIKHSIINSKKIIIKNISDEELEKICLLCHFPNAEELKLSTNYLEKSLLFLPKAFPSLLNLSILGEIDNTDFLYNFNKLSDCSIFEDTFEIDELFKEKINNIVRILNRLGYSEEEKQLYLNGKLDINPISDVSYYYTYNTSNDICKLEKPNEEEYYYRIYDNYLYKMRDEKKYKYVTIKKQMDTPELFIYNSIGKPIVLKK